jgi:hypothetical protein
MRPTSPYGKEDERRRGTRVYPVYAVSYDAHHVCQDVSSDIMTDKASEACVLQRSLAELVRVEARLAP